MKALGVSQQIEMVPVLLHIFYSRTPIVVFDQ